MTFSGANAADAHKLRKLASRVIAEEGFAVNTKKTRVMNQGTRQLVTGVTVNEVLGLSRKKRRVIRAMIHKAQSEGITAERLAELRGLVDWVHMLNAEQAKPLRRKLPA